MFFIKALTLLNDSIAGVIDPESEDITMLLRGHAPTPIPPSPNGWHECGFLYGNDVMTETHPRQTSRCYVVHLAPASGSQLAAVT